MDRSVFDAKFNHRTVDVLGFGISNRPLVRMLLESGAQVTVHDAKEPGTLGPEALEAQSAGAKFDLFDKDAKGSLDGDYIFRSPGIRPDVPAITEALFRGAVLTSEMELFLELTPAMVLGITGSDGKTTTTTLTGLFLEGVPGRNVYVGGNIGKPLLPLVFDMKKEDIAVLELSSFQLMTLRRSPERALITNVTPNHLNWHTGMDEYVEAKSQIMRHRPISLAVLNADNPVTRKLGENSDVRITYFSSRRSGWHRIVPEWQSKADAVYIKDGYICHGGQGIGEERILNIDSVKLPGTHNLENYMAAIALTHGLCTNERILDVAKTFPGVPHRLEWVRNRDGVDYYNSSIDSTPSRTEVTLRALMRQPIVIMGGRDKHLPYDALCAYLPGHVKAVVLTGEAMPLIRDAIRASDPEGKIPVFTEPDFDKAVRLAAGLSRPGDTVLLSPSCTSFDAFPNFEVRGDRFKEIVMEL